MQAKLSRLLVALTLLLQLAATAVAALELHLTMKCPITSIKVLESMGAK